MGTLFGCTRIQQDPQNLIMNSFVVFATLLAAAWGAPQVRLVKTVVEGPQTGPLTALVGNLVQTPKGLRPIDLEGFSEDLDQDGFVDPVAPAAPAPVAVAPAPVAAQVATPFATPFAAPFAAPFAPRVLASSPVAQPIFAAPQVVRTAVTPTVVSAPAPVAAPAPIVRHVATPTVVKTISPLPVAVRAAPSAVT